MYNTKSFIPVLVRRLIPTRFYDPEISIRMAGPVQCLLKTLLHQDICPGLHSFMEGLTTVPYNINTARLLVNQYMFSMHRA